MYLDGSLSFSLPIPQGNYFELKVEEAQYNFYLNDTVVEQIKQVKIAGDNLEIPPRLLVLIWYYACFGDGKIIPKETKGAISQWGRIFDVIFVVRFLKLFLKQIFQQKTPLQSGIIFNSYYRETGQNSSDYNSQDIVLQSNVMLNGDIFHKVCQDLIGNPNYLSILSVHYWLTEQLVNNLWVNLNRLVWEIVSFVPAIFIGVHLYSHQGGVLVSIIAWLGATVGFSTIQTLLVNQLQKYTSIKSKYLNWIVWVLNCLTPIILNPDYFWWLVIVAIIVPPLLFAGFYFILPRVSKLVLSWLIS